MRKKKMKKVLRMQTKVHSDGRKVQESEQLSLSKYVKGFLNIELEIQISRT
jgi:hypothetical protein